MNIKDSSAIHKCTSCQMCSAVCPASAIRIELNEEGFYRPVVDEKACINCNACTKVCYKFEPNIQEFGASKLKKTGLYGASAKQDGIVKATTSGGIADLLAKKLVSEGYKCVGVVYDGDNDRAIDKIACTASETDGFRGSKYIQSYTVDAFKEVTKNCRKEKYAIFGTPCQIYALNKYLSQRHIREKHLLIDIYCHGCPSMLIWKKYIKEVKQNIGQKKIDYVNFRSKIKGWGNYYVVAVVDGCPVYYSNHKHNDFFDLFFCDELLNDACSDCKLRGTLEYTDIRLGDFWGKQYVLNKRGVSAVSVVTENGRKVFKEIADEINYKEESYADFLPWQSWGKTYDINTNLRDSMLDMLRKEQLPLKTVVEYYNSNLSPKAKVIKRLKSLVESSPSSVEKTIRWLFYRLE